MWLVKKFYVIAMAFLIVTLFSVEASAEKKIGILLWTKDLRYTEVKKGIMDQLDKDGFGEPIATYTIANAEGSKAKATEIVQIFSEVKMDLIFTIGTSATIPAAQAIHDVPIVFSMVYNPVVTGIAKSEKSSGNNTTGVLSRPSKVNLLSILAEFAQVKRLAVLYTPNEKNTVAQLTEIQNLQKTFPIEIFPVILNRKEEVDQILSKVIQTVDAVYLTGSSIVGMTIQEIVDIANKEKVITITHHEDMVKQGALLGACSNSYQIGRLSGKKAVKILKGTQPSSIPIEPGEKTDLILNMKTAKAGQFKIPPEFMKKVTKTIE